MHKINQVRNFVVPPHFVENWFLADKGGTYFVRIILENKCTKLAKLGNQNAPSGISMICNMTGS